MVLYAHIVSRRVHCWPHKTVTEAPGNITFALQTVILGSVGRKKQEGQFSPTRNSDFSVMLRI